VVKPDKLLENAADNSGTPPYQTLDEQLVVSAMPEIVVQAADGDGLTDPVALLDMRLCLHEPYGAAVA